MLGNEIAEPAEAVGGDSGRVSMTPARDFHVPPRSRPRFDAGTGRVDDLVRPGWVHGSVYADEGIYQLEMERIFHRNWVYVGHESEIARTGEFRLRKIGRQPVIFVRGKDDVVRVLLNRCRHRGAAVCELESGREKFFRCWFHGWTYDNTGKLNSVTGPEGYGPDFDPADHSLTSAALVESYRGFVFASLVDNGQTLAEHLGPAARMIDIMIDASPTGRISATAGCNKTVYRGNWKLVGMDGYHPHYVHASVVSMWHRDADSGLGATHRADPYDVGSNAQTRDLLNGHAMLDLREHRVRHFDAYRPYLESLPGGPAYIAAIEARHEPAYATQLLAMAGDPHIGVFPNMQMINNQIRIINPLSASETEVIMFPILFEGMADELNTVRLRQHESFYGPASAGSPDDAEIFERVQQGFNAEVDPWVDISRGMHREFVDADGTIVGHISDEVPQRGQMRQWLKLMTDEGAA